MNMICILRGSLCVFVLTRCVCVCQQVQLAAQCLCIPARSVRPALRHCARLHLRPRNVLSSSSSSSQRPSHSSPTPSAGPSPSGPDGHLGRLNPAHLGPHKVRKLGKSTAKTKKIIKKEMLRPEAGKSRGSMNPADLLFLLITS